MIALAGALFTLGLALSGVTRPSAILDAFHYDARWDPSIALMFVGANLVMIPATRWLARRPRTRAIPHRRVDRSLVVGSLVFGVGWGLSGLCPGPAVGTIASGGWHVLAAFAGMCVGIVVHDRSKAS